MILKGNGFEIDGVIITERFEIYENNKLIYTINYPLRFILKPGKGYEGIKSIPDFQSYSKTGSMDFIVYNKTATYNVKNYLFIGDYAYNDTTNYVSIGYDEAIAKIK